MMFSQQLTEGPLSATFDATTSNGTPAILGFIAGEHAMIWSQKTVPLISILKSIYFENTTLKTAVHKFIVNIIVLFFCKNFVPHHVQESIKEGRG